MSDMWGAGCCLFELLFGYPPFTGEDKALVLRIIKEIICYSKHAHCSCGPQTAPAPPHGDGDQGDQALSRAENELFPNAENLKISDVPQMLVQNK